VKGDGGLDEVKVPTAKRKTVGDALKNISEDKAAPNKNDCND